MSDPDLEGGSARPRDGGPRGGRSERAEPAVPPGPMSEPPPVLRSWGIIYALVLVNLLVCILLFYAFGRIFS